MDGGSYYISTHPVYFQVLACEVQAVLVGAVLFGSCMPIDPCIQRSTALMSHVGFAAAREEQISTSCECFGECKPLFVLLHSPRKRG